MVTAPTDPPDPLRFNVPIVSIKDGTPTQEFLRQWNRQRVVNVTVEDVTIDLTALETAVANIEAIDIIAGVGLSGGGSLGDGPADITLDLEDTAVTPGTYGNSTNVAQITVDQQGRITAASNVVISGGGSGSGGGGGYWTFVEEVTASAVAELDIDLPSATRILLSIESLTPATDTADLYARFTSDGFANIISSTVYKWFFRRSNVTGGVGAYGAGTGTPGNHIEMSDNDGSASGEDGFGEIIFTDPANATKLSKMTFDLMRIGSDGNPNRCIGACSLSAGTAINGVRLYFSSGNIANAVVRVYAST